MRLKAGQRIGPYEIETSIGSGAMGEVYKARDTRLGRSVAIKVLPEQLSRDADRVQRFEREARAASQLNHPNIVQVYDVGNHDGIYYIAMEYVEGRTLREILGDGPLPANELFRYARQLAEGLAKAHAAGVVHRDLKPDNVIINDDGNVKILDFGLAKLEVSPTEVSSEGATLEHEGTTPGTILGTIGYMSPEQARGESADHRTDQFALGAILYEMATAKKAFARPTAAETLAALLESDPPSLSAQRSELPSTFCALVERCIEKRAADRYSSTVEVLERLLETPSLETGSLPRKRALTVGREESLDRLEQVYESARQERGLLVCIAGEAGIGKTTLVETFLEKMRTQDSSFVARGRCSERLAGADVYVPFLEALEDLLANRTAARLLKERAPSWYEQVKPRTSSEGEPKGAGSQELLKRELSAFFEELSTMRPVIVFFDDLHWADAPTVDVLAYLADRFDKMKVLFVTTYRPEDLQLRKSPFLDVRRDLQARKCCTEIQLPFLSVDDVERYLELQFPAHQLPSELGQLIHQKTEGSPLFMADLVRYLRDREIVAEVDGAWSLAGSLANIENELPESIRAMIDRKLELLGKEERRVLAAASIEGAEFHSATISRVLSRDPAEVEEQLDLLRRVHGLIELVDETEFPDRTFTMKYRFVHVLYQNALFESLSPTRRASMSRKAAGALLEFYKDNGVSIASALALLFQAARDHARAAKFVAQAAQNASRVFAYREAASLARQGLALIETLPDDETRAVIELDLCLALGPALGVTEGWAVFEVKDAYQRAKQLCERVGDSAKLFTALWGFWLVRANGGEMVRADELGDEILALGEASDDAAQRLQGYHAAWPMKWIRGEFERGFELTQQGLAYYDPDKHAIEATRYGGHDPGVCGKSFAALNTWFRGYADRAVVAGEESVALARRVNHRPSLAHAMWYLAFIHQYRRDVDKVQEWGDALVTLATGEGWVPYSSVGRILIGWSAAMKGSLASGLDSMREGLKDYGGGGLQMFAVHFNTMLAEVYLKSGRPEGASSALEEAAVLAGKGNLYWSAENRRLRGEVALHETVDDPDQAEEHFRHALQIAHGQGAKLLELRAATSLAKLWRVAGRRHEAKELLGSLHSWFSEGFDTHDWIEAKATLDNLD